jgi:tetratricopeptide (TPR) repeat protein
MLEGRMLLAGLRCALTSTLMVLLLAAGASAQAASPKTHGITTDDQEARDLFRLGKQAFDEGRLERALKYFKDSYELSHRPALLSSIGSTLDRLRRDQEALEAYQHYLEQVPDAPNRALIEERVRIISAAMEKPNPGEAQATAPTSEAVPTPAAAALAQPRETSAPIAATQADSGRGSSPALTSRWWFWAGLGAVAVTATVVGVAASSGGGGSATETAAVLGSGTRVRSL